MRFAYFWTEPRQDGTWVVLRHYYDESTDSEISTGHAHRGDAEHWLDEYYKRNVVATPPGSPPPNG